MFRNVCLAQGVGNNGAFLTVLKHRLHNNFMQNCHDILNICQEHFLVKLWRSFNFKQTWDQGFHCGTLKLLEGH